MAIRTPGPLAMSTTREAWSTARSVNPLPTPEEVAAVTGQLNDAPWDVSLRVERVLLLLGLGAAHILAEEGYAARDVLTEAENEIDNIEKLTGELTPLLQNCRAVLNLNGSVLFYETDNEDSGDRFLFLAWKSLMGTSPEHRNEYFAPVAEHVSTLARVARSQGRRINTLVS